MYMNLMEKPSTTNTIVCFRAILNCGILGALPAPPPIYIYIYIYRERERETQSLSPHKVRGEINHVRPNPYAHFENIDFCKASINQGSSSLAIG